MNIFLENTLKLVSGNIIAQLLSILTIPLITRLFGVEEFGVFSITLSIATILATIYLCGLHLAILIPSEDIEALGIVRFILFVGTFLSFLCCFLCIVFSDELTLLISIGYMQLMSIPILSFSIMLCTLISFWGVRIKEYTLTSKSKVVESIVDRAGSIVFGFLGYTSSLTLTAFKFVSGMVSTIYFLFLSRHKDKYIIKPVDVWPIIEILKKYKGYILYNTPSSIMTVVSLQIPLVLIGIYFSPLYAGFFAMANRIINIPIQTIGATVSKLITQDLSINWYSQRILAERKIEFFYLTITPLLLYPFAFLAITGQKLTLFLLGPNWGLAGSILQVLTFLALSNLLIQCFGGVFDILEQQSKRLLYHTINVIVRILSIVIPPFFDCDFETTILIFAISGSIMNVCALTLIFSLVNCSVLSILSKWPIFFAIFVVYIFSMFLDSLQVGDIIFILSIFISIAMVFIVFSYKSMIFLAKK